ncbi:MAG: hypothetical protein WC455_16970 [Dehalococcoidia bacterium]|jgi:hypothetical protein
MIIDASPIQLALGTVGLMLVALVFLYIASRLMASGAARSWYDFWKDKNNKGGKQ